MDHDVIIGLEIHAELKTRSKMFCACDNSAQGKAPNSVVCPICLGHPGTLPIPNRQAIEWTILLGLALDGQINKTSKFDRKNYFYPDLPKGYQTSQYDKPIIEHGHVEIEVDGATRIIGITRMHMEEDAGKLVHDDREPVSYVDLNRTGTPLLEIVSEPDMRSPQEATAYLKKIHAILRYLNIFVQ